MASRIGTETPVAFNSVSSFHQRLRSDLGYDYAINPKLDNVDGFPSSSMGGADGRTTPPSS
jgi:hypothetical protein